MYTYKASCCVRDYACMYLCMYVCSWSMYTNVHQSINKDKYTNTNTCFIQIHIAHAFPDMYVHCVCMDM